MSISLPPSTLAILLAIMVVLIICFQLANLRRRGPVKTVPRRTKRSPAGKGWSPFPNRHAPSRKRDHGLAIATKYGLESRSPQWPAVAHAHLAHEPACRVCGHRGQGLQVHHIKPFHLFPELELDPNNLITLCELKGRDHHLLIGHLDDWEAYNPHVRTDVDKYHNEKAATIRTDPNWLKEERNRPQTRA